MLFVLVLASVIGTASAGCCLPAQWEGKEGFMMGTIHFMKPRLTSGMLRIHWDSINQQLAVNETIHVDGTVVNLIVVKDYSSGVAYIVEEGKCKKEKIQTPFPSGCIPNNATVARSFFLGSGSDTLDVIAYHIQGDDLETMVYVTKSACIPVQERIYGRFGQTPVLQAVGFGNITPGIRDPSVFDVPAACKKEFLEEIVSYRIPSIFGF